MSSCIKWIIVTFFLVVFGNLLNAQKNIEKQHLIWTRYNGLLVINTNYQIRQELEERAYYAPCRQHQFVTRTIAERKIAKGWSAGIGFTYFLQTLPHDPQISDVIHRNELRPQIEIAHLHSLNSKFSVQHRYWTEFRIFEQTEGGFAFGNNRTRYRLELRFVPNEKITLRVFDEVFLNFGKNIVMNVFDQNRVGLSMQYMPVKSFGLEVGYFNWFQQQPSGQDFFSRHILRITLHHVLKLEREKSE